MEKNYQSIEKIAKVVQPSIQPDDITPNYTSSHKHNGIDTPRIRLQDIQGIGNLIQIIGVADATAAPTYIPSVPIVFQYDTAGGGHWRMWVRINNLWKSVSLS